MSSSGASASRRVALSKGSKESLHPRTAFEEQRPGTDIELVHKPCSSQLQTGSYDRDKEMFSRAENEGGANEDPSAKKGQKFFSNDSVIAALRKDYFKIVGRATLLIIILTWVCLPIYWGSLSAAPKLTGNLEAWVVNRDQARFGNTLENSVQSAPTTGVGALWWRVVNASHFETDEDVAQAVVNERTWLAVVVSENATARLTDAQRNGDETYDPTSALTVYYAQARNEIAAGTYLLPLTTTLLENFTTTYATSMAQRYFAAIILQNGTVNETAINSIARAPQTISPGVGYKLVNLRPYTASVAQAPLLVGQIYICIFAFIFVMAHSTARDKIKPHVSVSSYLAIRVITPLVVFFPLTMNYALISLAFKLPFGSRPSLSYGDGFILFFAVLYLGMTSLGFALESMVTILSPKFVPFFLVLLIIVNISTAALPPELTPRLYNYGTVSHFYNIQQALRTVFFNTESYLPKNAGILLAWVFLSIVMTVLLTWLHPFTWIRYWCSTRLNYKSNRHFRKDLDTHPGYQNTDCEKNTHGLPDKKGVIDHSQLPYGTGKDNNVESGLLIVETEERK